MDVIMPQLGETVAEGVVTRWYKKAGDAVKADEVLFDVETDKVSTEVPAPAGGIVEEILVEEGAIAKVGARLAVIRESDAAAQAESGPIAPSVSSEVGGSQRINPTAEHAPEIARPPLVPPPGGAQDRLSPAVRKLIAENGLDVRTISGTGREGRITREDVAAHIASLGKQARSDRSTPPTAPDPAMAAERMEAAAPEVSSPEAQPLGALRQRVAENVLKAWMSVPHVLQVAEADFHRVEQARRAFGAQWKHREGFGLTYLPFVARAVSIALGRYPKLNATFSGERLTLQRRINLGIAVDLNFEGLIIPVVKDLSGKSLPQLAREINDLAVRARAGKLTPDELTEGTYTITNNGAYGAVMTAPIINIPQVAILSTDSVRKKAVVIEAPEGDSIAIRPIGVLAQSFDHRAVDGAYAASFLRELKLIIETRNWTDDLES